MSPDSGTSWRWGDRIGKVGSVAFLLPNGFLNLGSRTPWRLATLYDLGSYERPCILSITPHLCLLDLLEWFITHFQPCETHGCSWSLACLVWVAKLNSDQILYWAFLQNLTWDVFLQQSGLYHEISYSKGHTKNRSDSEDGVGYFRSGTVDRNPPASAGDMDLIPGPGRSHMPWSNQACGPQLLRLGAITTEAWAPRACALQQQKQL